MSKFFGLFIFIDFFLVGILLGLRRRRLTLSTVKWVFFWFLAVYLLMGMILAINLQFVLPK